MTREEFSKVLDKKSYSYEIEGDRIIVTCGKSVMLDSLISLPSGVEFKNRGHVSFSALTSLSSGVKFENGGDVGLNSLTSLPSGVEFENKGNVYLDSLIGGWFNEWEGNIEGIDSKRLLNLMISKGVFI